MSAVLVLMALYLSLRSGLCQDPIPEGQTTPTPRASELSDLYTLSTAAELNTLSISRQRMTGTSPSTTNTGVFSGDFKVSISILVVVAAIVEMIIVIMILICANLWLMHDRRVYIKTLQQKSARSVVGLESNVAYGGPMFGEEACYETIDSDNETEPTLTEKSARSVVGLESNVAYGGPMFGEEAYYETIDSDIETEPTLTAEKSDGLVVELESNAAYGGSMFREEACYEAIDSDNETERTLTDESDGSVVELESNTAHGESMFGEEACYETIDIDDSVQPSLTRAFPTGGVSNLQHNETYV